MKLIHEVRSSSGQSFCNRVCGCDELDRCSIYIELLVIECVHSSILTEYLFEPVPEPAPVPEPERIIRTTYPPKSGQGHDCHGELGREYVPEPVPEPDSVPEPEPVPEPMLVPE